MDIRKLSAAAQEERRREVVGVCESGLPHEAIAAQVGPAPSPPALPTTTDRRHRLPIAPHGAEIHGICTQPRMAGQYHVQSNR